ncbi:hypothetical protein, partial [Pseudomonas syringae group genomosp. 7]|uniref:hypothetical protein n=1 Tax=Pseudomonas syringae group genomosp. 7 TaxID=251699 RepID=UPI00376FF30C
MTRTEAGRAQLGSGHDLPQQVAALARGPRRCLGRERGLGVGGGVEFVGVWGCVCCCCGWCGFGLGGGWVWWGGWWVWWCGVGVLGVFGWGVGCLVGGLWVWGGVVLCLWGGGWGLVGFGWGLGGLGWGVLV